jgi:putative membrane protein
MWPRLQRWRGVILIAAAVAATTWMAFGNQLVLYIHPRYIVFTVVMAAIALALVVASAATGTRDDHDEVDAPSRGWPRVLAIAALAVSSAVAVAMVVLPPATLTSSTASQRDINSTTVGQEAQSVDSVDAAPVGAFKAFTVVDWASLLRQTSDLDFYGGKPVDVVGFITADPDDPQNVFYVSRFVVTCCAVDAQPTGVPVYLADWPSTYALDDWVRVTGEFTTNPSARSGQAIALAPDKVTEVEQPSEPYLF